MRVAVVDIGTNSTRLLIAEGEADGTGGRELHRESTVTRLGENVDASGRLGDVPMQRVADTLAGYRRTIDEHDVERSVAVLTSAVRDAANGVEFTQRIADEFGLDARILSGDDEAAVTFFGATAGRARDGRHTVVIDIGGGSTEFICGVDGEMTFNVSTQAGVVRQSERHITADPPEHDDLVRLAEDVGRTIAAAVPAEVRERTERAIAVAGTATSAAAIELELEPYDPSRVHGHALLLGTCELQLARLAQMDEAERREIAGLHPDRASVIIAGLVMLVECMRAFDLQSVEVSEHDILRGAALRLAAGGF